MMVGYGQSHFLIGNIKPLLGLLVLLVLAPVVFWAGQTAIGLFTNAAPIPANIVVNARAEQGILKRPWEGLSQGGEQEVPGKLVSIAPVASQIKNLGIKYIRVDHVLEEPFNNSIRARVQEIQASGAIPFISLSYFPKSVSGSNIGTVSNWSAWQNEVQKLIETVSGRNGMNISGVYYEVWNEPDGENFGGFNIGSGKDYFVLYQKTVEAANRAKNVNSFKIGGPSLADLRRCTNGALFVCREYWLDKFLSLVAKNRVRIDYVSWHKYATKLSDYNDDVNFIMNMYNKYSLPSVEKIITEWGSAPERNPMHNTVFDAAHLVAAARAFVGYVDLATKFEVRDGPDSGNQGWGILYFGGAKKPTYEAMRLLSKLRENRIGLNGEGTNVTGIASRNSSGITVILSNYDRRSSNAESVPVKITGLNAGRYRLTKSIINSANPLGKTETSIVQITGDYLTKELMLANSVVEYDLQLIGF